MQFNAEEYYQVSLERIKQAESLYREERSYSLAMYCAGLSVETLLRAFRWTEDPSFEGRHDLNDLLKASRILKIDYDYLERKGLSDAEVRAASLGLRTAVNEVIVLWHNNLRFSSEKRLKAFLKRIDRLQGRGDPLKRNSLQLITAAQVVINRGMTLWPSLTK
ncbi:MAG TPA: hypothetical protein VHZ24_16535 [Pirellulales bacterium]|nr:hypothetical protein [Pirellulales bacterium]